MRNKHKVGMDQLVSLCKRRGFIFQSSEIYEGINGFWDYGPLGCELKRNVREAWWKNIVQLREDVVGLDSSIIMHPKVWEASGHATSFVDPMVDCRKCRKRFRADMLCEDQGQKLVKTETGFALPPGIKCSACGATGTYTYSATAIAGSISSWSLRIDGGPILASGGGNVSSSYIWGGSGLAAGTYTVRITATDTNGNSSSATQSVTLLAAPTITLSRDYANLLYYGPKLGQPAQRLYGSANGGGGAPYTLTLTLTRPDATTVSYVVASDAGGSFQLTPASSGDPYLGATQVGTWSARAATGGANSNIVTWTVRWFQVNERP